MWQKELHSANMTFLNFLIVAVNQLDFFKVHKNNKNLSLIFKAHR